ncbi:lysophospholipid acyltransferase family protein [Pseudonocardia nantongensis]|uniref:lysophospholipid acyltransferase family protein n=1 Tax=Pseudonocardia nantongensis TaxID=1181885 RepID=UPI00397857E8
MTVTADPGPDRADHDHPPARASAGAARRRRSALHTSTQQARGAHDAVALRTPAHHPARSALCTPAGADVGHPTHPVTPPAAERPGGPWATWSPCTPRQCLPARATTGGLRLARRIPALLTVLAVAALAVPAAALAGARVLDPLLRALHRMVLRGAGVRLVVRGGPLAPPDGRGALVVADHTSWIDVPALGAIGPVTMLAKREVRDWPVIGTLAARTGTLFVHREGLSRLPATVATTAAALRAGAVVGVFPEATTWCGAVGGDYRRAPFQAAIDAGVPVRPVTLAITTPDGRSNTAAAFVGDQSLGDTMVRVLRLPGLVCTVTVGEPIEPGDDDRRALARTARDRVRYRGEPADRASAPVSGAHRHG